MKKILLVVVLISQVVLNYGCKEKAKEKKEETSFSGNPALVGIWVGDDYTITVESVTEQIIKAGNEVTKATTYTFNSGGTFSEKVAQYESNGSWEGTADSLIIKYEHKAGPNDRRENRFKILTLNDSLLQLEFKLQNYGSEVYTYKKQK